ADCFRGWRRDGAGDDKQRAAGPGQGRRQARRGHRAHAGAAARAPLALAGAGLRAAGAGGAVLHRHAGERPRRAGEAAMSNPAKQKSRRDIVIAASCGAVVGLMIGAAYAAVPLYDWFCRTTGFGGTTQVSHAAPARVLDRTITVRFDGNVMPGLPWKFEP